MELKHWQQEAESNRRLIAEAKTAQATLNDPNATWGEKVDAASAVLGLRPQLVEAAGRIRRRLDRR